MTHSIGITDNRFAFPHRWVDMDIFFSFSSVSQFLCNKPLRDICRVPQIARVRITSCVFASHFRIGMSHTQHHRHRSTWQHAKFSYNHGYKF